MATGNKKRFAYFTPLQLEILVHPYSEFEHVFKIESNSATVAKDREQAWEKIGVAVNA